MNSIYAYLVSGLLALSALLFPSRTFAAGKNYNEQFFLDYFATVSSVLIYDDFQEQKAQEQFQELCRRIEKELKSIDAAVSVSIPESDIYRFNQLSFGESLSVSDITASLILAAKEVYELTGGYYDPSVMMLTDLWGFTPRFRSENSSVKPYDRVRADDGSFPLPDEKYIQAFCELTDFEKIQLSGGSDTGWKLSKMIPDVTVDGVTYSAQLNLSSIAKGYAVDQVVSIMKDMGYENGYFSCGKSSIGFLKSASSRSLAEGNQSFRMSIEKPRPGSNDEASFLSTELQDISISSSGDFDHCYQTDGVIYCHIINPFTGYPANTPAASGSQSGTALVTVTGDSAMMADALSTALCLMPLNDALSLYNNELSSEYDVILTLYDENPGGYFLTSLESESCTLLDPLYRNIGFFDSTGALCSP